VIEAADLKLAFMVFWMIFIAELGDKTQVATLLLAADRPAARWVIFAGAASALVLSSAIGVIAGGWISHYLPERTVQFFAGVTFAIVGLWMVLKTLLY
jgi:putative Ca2+/H+ antiporter (TMEM165/GDT1 family)